MNDMWAELLAKKKKANNNDHTAYDEIYEEMLTKFPAKILEDFEVNPATQELSKRSTRVKRTPPEATDSEFRGEIMDIDEVRNVQFGSLFRRSRNQTANANSLILLLVMHLRRTRLLPNDCSSW